MSGEEEDDMMMMAPVLSMDELKDFHIDDEDEDELRALAASLAPKVSEMLNEEAFENLLGGSFRMPKSDTSAAAAAAVSQEDEDDYDMDDELEHLAEAEESLRQELDSLRMSAAPVTVTSPVTSPRLSSTSLLDEEIEEEENEDDDDDDDEDDSIAEEEEVVDHEDAMRAAMAVMGKFGATEPVERPNTLLDRIVLEKNKAKSSMRSSALTVSQKASKAKSSLAAAAAAHPLDLSHLRHSTTKTLQQLKQHTEAAATRIESQEPEDERMNLQSRRITTSTSDDAYVWQDDDDDALSPYVLRAHAKQMGLLWDPSDLGAYTVAVPHSSDNSDNDEEDEQRINLMKESVWWEYVVPLKDPTLGRIYAGLYVPPPSSTPPPLVTSSITATTPVEEIPSHELPVRTVAIRIRPDVLVGAVMDAVYQAVSAKTVNADVTKRQGGHLQAVLPEFDGYIIGSILLDAQLVTKKRPRVHQSHQEFERILLIRTYRIPFSTTPVQTKLASDKAAESSLDGYENVASIDEDEEDGKDGLMHLQNASALVQHMVRHGEYAMLDETAVRKHYRKHVLHLKSSSKMGDLAKMFSPSKLFSPSSSNNSGGDEPPVMTPDEEISFYLENETEAISSYMLHLHEPSASVSENVDVKNFLLLPALSKLDALYVQASSKVIRECFSELDTRDLAYATFGGSGPSAQFGAFPALPTLDVHFCSQIRTVCRERMIVTLLKMASELEQYARESEYSCANLIQLLRPTFRHFHLTPPALPQPVPLTAYPLEFSPPEVSCPPWGLLVMEALNKVAAMTSDAGKALTSGESVPKSGFVAAPEAVSLVASAFQKQDDKEQSARLGRKNVQVMDRLAKMQNHKRTSIIAIRDSYGTNILATKAADEFHELAQKAIDAKKKSTGEEGETSNEDGFLPASDQAVLLKCSVLVGGSTGTCYVTAHQILFVTQFLPIVGGSRYTLFPLADLNMEVIPPIASMLNPLPPSIRVSIGNKDVFSFIPSLGGKRFKSFIGMVQAVSTEDPETLQFSDRGGFLYMADEDNRVKVQAEKDMARIAAGGNDNEDANEL